MRFFCFVLVTLSVISFCFKADAFDIECKFYKMDRGYGAKNGCEVQSVTFSLFEDSEITSVNGDYGATYNDVGWFLSQSIIFNSFPKNINKFFPNVELLQIFNASIATLTKSDLSPFGSELRTFYFYNNKIEVIEADLFDENPSLENIYLAHNQIRLVGSGAFDKLPKLTSLYFGHNPCHPSGNANKDRTAVVDLIKVIEGNCQEVQISTTTTEKPEEEAKVEEPSTEITQLKAILADIQQQHNNCKLELEGRQVTGESTGSEILKILKELKTEITQIHAKFTSIDAKMEAKFASLDAKFDSVEGKLDSNKDSIEVTKSICSTTNHKTGLFNNIYE